MGTATGWLLDALVQFLKPLIECLSQLGFLDRPLQVTRLHPFHHPERDLRGCVRMGLSQQLDGAVRRHRCCFEDQFNLIRLFHGPLPPVGTPKGFGNLSARHGPRLHQAPSDRVGHLSVRKRGSNLNQTALWLRTSRQRQGTRLLGDRYGVQGIGLGIAQANPRSISKRS